MWKECLLGAAILGAASCTLAASATPATPNTHAPLAVAVVQASGTSGQAGYDGVVEAVRQTVLAAQVSGAIVAVNVKAGDHVKAGQVLLRIDARAANQNAAASDAQVLAARSSLALASSELERQRRLYQKQYISRAALERAEAQFRATSADVAAQLAQAGAARTQSGFFVLKAPYDGVVAEVPAMPGDMAMPGRPLLTLYDPAVLRVTAALPQMVAARLPPEPAAKLELPELPPERRWPAPARVQLLPMVDAATHTAQIRVDLPAASGNLAPGMFARVWLPLPAGATPRLFVPAGAIVDRAELSAVYVIGQGGQPVLRQVRLGPRHGGMVEVLAGVSAGEQVALDPQAAARWR
jgi:RND family efflux transporter MFP subunit